MTIKKIDKSNGKGCIGCEVVKGKTCEDCTHKNDLIKKTRRQNEQNNN